MMRGPRDRRRFRSISKMKRGIAMLIKIRTPISMNRSQTLRRKRFATRVLSVPSVELLLFKVLCIDLSIAKISHYVKNV